MGKLNFTVASAVEATNAPPIPKAQAWGRTYQESPTYGPLLGLSQGVPKSAPHDTVLSALSAAASDPESARYGPILGEPALREAYAEETRIQYQLSAPSAKGGNGGAGVHMEDIAITTGCNMAFLTLIMALCPPGRSSALIPLPAYFNQMMVFSLQSVKPIYIPSDTENGFKADINAAREYLLSPKQLQKREEEGEEGVKPRMIVLVSPNNPTGAVYSHEELKEWFELAKEARVALVLDETYRDFVEGQGSQEGERGVPHRLFEEEDWRSTLVSLGSFSKGYRIPGHRLGSIIASPELLKHLTTVCDCMQICAPRPPQIAIAPLLPSLRPDLLDSSSALSKRRRLFVKTVQSVPGWNVPSTGGYFAYVSFPSDYQYASSVLGLKRKKLSSEDIAKVLAEKVGVVTLPGSFFMPDLKDQDVWEEDVLPGGEVLKEDKWLRFAVANVDDDVILQLGPRLREMNKLMGLE
ncbi:arylformamidase [Kwoniella heveanensis BCC8398]|uniref:Arylformamidase n=1 Tax=Kwoniella heveanensis BCC8398 TaxID=1296120 RepID=A0A1B9GU78_9TREE|nr:arylformamidase [Kwoniella heveanensis BCC8398]